MTTMDSFVRSTTTREARAAAIQSSPFTVIGVSAFAAAVQMAPMNTNIRAVFFITIFYLRDSHFSMNGRFWPAASVECTAETGPKPTLGWYSDDIAVWGPAGFCCYW